MLSSILQIILGVIFLGHNLFVTISLPVVLAWWAALLLGIAGAVLVGFFGLKNPDVAGATLSWLIGLGIISTGVSYLVALCGINRVEKHVKQFRANVKAAIDEQ